MFVLCSVPAGVCLDICPCVYVYVHLRLLLRLRLRPPGWDRARTCLEQSKNKRPEHAAKPQGLAHGETLGQ